MFQISCFNLEFYNIIITIIEAVIKKKKIKHLY